jgi:hypothetical protein
LTLSSAHTSLTLEALVDSGADVNVLPYTIGLGLGLRWEEHPAGGFVLGGFASSETKLVRLSVEIDQWAVVELIFAWLDHDRAPLVLGTIDFLMKFDVYFAAGAGYFEITQRTNPLYSQSLGAVQTI